MTTLFLQIEFVACSKKTSNGYLPLFVNGVATHDILTGILNLAVGRLPYTYVCQVSDSIIEICDWLVPRRITHAYEYGLGILHHDSCTMRHVQCIALRK